MAVSIADIQKIRKLTGAGLADCKKALTDAEGDFDKAVQIIREKGQAIAAKRSDRETSNGCVLVKADNGFSAMIALKCETDFVAKNADFQQFVSDDLDPLGREIIDCCLHDGTLDDYLQLTPIKLK